MPLGSGVIKSVECYAVHRKLTEWKKRSIKTISEPILKPKLSSTECRVQNPKRNLERHLQSELL